jgi:hypothetical protein
MAMGPFGRMSGLASLNWGRAAPFLGDLRGMVSSRALG